MGIFTRMRDIINSNINAMLEKAEDPEKLIKLMIQEMEDTLVEIKASCAGAMASSKKVARQLEELRARAEKWGANAELAVQKGREDLAREALQERRAAREQVESLERELVDCDSVVEQYRADIAQLEEKLATAKEKHRVLVERHIHAQRKKTSETQVRRAENSDAFARFAAFENRIDRMEAEASLIRAPRKRSLEDEITELRRDENIESELLVLKKEIAKIKDESKGQSGAIV